MAQRVYLLEVTAYDDTVSPPTTRTLRYSSGQATPFPPTDADRPNACFDPRLINPGTIRRGLYAFGRTAEVGAPVTGEAVIANTDGDLDVLLDYGMDGRTLVLKVGMEGQSWAQFDTILYGTVEQPEISYSNQSSVVTLRIRDRQAELRAKPIQTTKYAGTNSGTTGDEGTAADLKGLPKPLLYGQCSNVEGRACNTAGLRYQFHDGSLEDITAVYDKGVQLTKDATPSSPPAPGAGEWDWWDQSEGIIILGSKPQDGRITADVKGDASSSPWDQTVADIIQNIAIDKGGLAIGEIDTTSFSALNTANSATIGISIREETTIGDVLDLICASVGAFWAFDRTGKLTVGRLEAPSGGSVLSLTSSDIIDLERIATQDDNRGVPAYRVLLNYDHNWTVQGQDELAGDVTEARRAYLGEAYRTEIATDATVQTKHLLAPEIERDTLLVSSSDASTEATRLLNLYKVRRDYLRVVVPLNSDTQDLDLYDVITVTFSRFGYDNGKDFRLLAILENDPSPHLVTLELWG